MTIKKIDLATFAALSRKEQLVIAKAQVNRSHLKGWMAQLMPHDIFDALLDTQVIQLAEVSLGHGDLLDPRPTNNATNALQSVHGERLVKDTAVIEWVDLCEGEDGDFNPNNPHDVRLLRFDVTTLEDGEQSEAISYCTYTPVSATPDQRQALLEYMMVRLHPLVKEVESLKSMCQKLSFIDLDVLEEVA